MELLAGASAALAVYLLAAEWERVREHGRLLAVVRVGRPARAPRLPPLRELWERALVGELPVHFVRVFAAATVVLFAFGLLSRSFGLLAIAAILLVIAGYVWLQRSTWTLVARVERQLPEAVTLLANGVAAGLTTFQALERAAVDVPPPLGPLLREAVARCSRNETLEESLTTMRDQIRSSALASLVATLAIHRRTGGNLARLLRDTAELMREEQRLQVDARVLSTQARYSAQLIGLMPPALFALFFVFFPSYIAPLTSTVAGGVVLAYCVASTAFGFYLIWRIALRIERT